MANSKIQKYNIAITQEFQKPESYFKKVTSKFHCLLTLTNQSSYLMIQTTVYEWKARWEGGESFPAL